MSFNPEDDVGVSGGAAEAVSLPFDPTIFGKKYFAKGPSGPLAEAVEGPEVNSHSCECILPEKGYGVVDSRKRIGSGPRCEDLVNLVAYTAEVGFGYASQVFDVQYYDSVFDVADDGCTLNIYDLGGIESEVGHLLLLDL